jgi:homoserine kinase
MPRFALRNRNGATLVPRFEAFRVRVPATSANLGPGFDAVGMALGLHLRALVEPAREFAMICGDGGEPPSHDGFARAVEGAIRHHDGALPRARVRIANDIPLGKGLGSSAAATVLGLAIAARIRNAKVDLRELARAACGIEGHPDNALPAVYGGAVICASSDGEDFLRIRAPRELGALVIVPDIDFSTFDARALLPERYDRCDVVFTAQRAAMLGAALASGSWRELGLAMHDRVHQPYRAPSIPGMEEALALRDRGVIGCALSGAGPSLIALLRPRTVWERIAPLFQACFTRAGIASRSFVLAPAVRGVSFARA